MPRVRAWVIFSAEVRVSGVCFAGWGVDSVRVVCVGGSRSSEGSGFSREVVSVFS